ncbi:hypothetical protein AAEO50_02810 [Rossellomorea oryzaecorticis]|uniref:Uncharacterized protein n=1 Tax=Rossellomorea oryzaecorticis TaxID=1396505 RepID=A0ABU9K658_9BACI
MDDKKKTSRDINKYSTSDIGNKNDRHNDNAKAAAALKQDYPRINTDNL